MKVTLLLLLAIGACATPAPRIVIHPDDLVEGMVAPADTNDHQKNIFGNHYVKNVNSGGHVFSCRYDQNTECRAPQADAWDHHDRSLDLDVDYYVIDRDNTMVKTDGIYFKKEFVHKTQIIKYNAVDYAGNAAPEVIVAFYVYDKVAPSMFVCIDSSNIGIGTIGNEYFEATNSQHLDGHADHPTWGYPVTHLARPFLGCVVGTQTTVTDTVDGSLPFTSTIKHVTDTGSTDEDAISLDVIGDYIVTFTAFDLSRNKVEESKTITIDDHKAPFITLKSGSATFECHQTTKYVDAGATCLDRLDGEINNNVESDPEKVVSDTQGSYTITYNCKDERGNAAVTKTREITVEDSTPPFEFFINGKEQVQFYAGEAEWMPSYDHSNDNTNDESRIHTAVHHATDKPDDATSRERMGSDYYLTDEQKQGKLDQWAQCEDECVGTVITNSFEPSWNHMVPGTYIETYHCEDVSANKNKADDITRTINLLDKHQPILILNGNSPQMVKAANDEVYKDAGAICTDEIDANISDKVQVSGDVAINVAEPGTYHVRYDCTDSHGNKGDQITRVVIVEDLVIPTIKLLGASIIGIEGSFKWQDPGATAWDELDGLLTERIVVTGTVNPYGPAHTEDTIEEGQMGVYTIKYNVEDDVGNAANTVVRTVVVKDTLPPIITLTRNGVDFGHDDNVKYNEIPYTLHGPDHTKVYKDRVTSSGAPNGNGQGAFSKQPTGFSNNEYHHNGGGYIMLNEQASTRINGWVVGAIASAITGLALLAMGMRKKNNVHAAIPV